MIRSDQIEPFINIVYIYLYLLLHSLVKYEYRGNVHRLAFTSISSIFSQKSNVLSIPLVQDSVQIDVGFFTQMSLGVYNDTLFSLNRP